MHRAASSRERRENLQLLMDQLEDTERTLLSGLLSSFWDQRRT